jgi:lipopolysaccharide/colanic/teichoic acid biosynthesis glycosyltransferase
MKIVAHDLETEINGLQRNLPEPFSLFGDHPNVTRYLRLGFKRLLDIIVAFSALVLLSSLMSIIALRLRSEGKQVFYLQRRVGKGGKEFFMYKFRTMVPNAETLRASLENLVTDGPLFKVRDDPRVTGFGRILRRRCLDEIPQLINVIKNEMSLVGPRPPRPKEVLFYEDWQTVRLEVMPGITGLWQIQEDRDWKFSQVLKFDFCYIKNCNLAFDLKILLKTLVVMVRGIPIHV